VTLRPLAFPTNFINFRQPPDLDQLIGQSKKSSDETRSNLMFSIGRRCCLSVLSFVLPIMLSAQSLSPPNPLQPVSQANRISLNADLASRVPLTGHVPRWATPANLVAGGVDPATPLRLSILLRRSSAAHQAFTQLLADQQNPGSPLYHHWISPTETGTLFGPTQTDVRKVVSWLESVGFIVRSIAPNRMTVEISGSVETATQGFQTTFSLYRPGSIALLAPNSEPLVPAALLPVVQFVFGLAEHHPSPTGGFDSPSAHPSYTNPTGGHSVTPADFATIYDLTTLLTTNTGATVGGKPQHVAILATSDADPADIQQFATSVASKSYNFTPIYADGVDPGYTNTQGEATADLERVLGTAPGVSADLVIGPTNNLSALYDAAYYAVNTLQDPIITASFGACETDLGQGDIQTIDSLWATAAANGISVFVAAGDSGAAGCDTRDEGAPATQFLSTNGLCTSQYDTCVGGTEFNDTANPSIYWSSTNTPGTMGSALSYIPEGAWNDPETNSLPKYVVLAGGGGASQYVSKPSWQTGPGVPADGVRDVPDVSFTASLTHDPYWVCIGGCGGAAAGTSCSTPSMAAIAALLNTAAGTAQGNLNALIYRLANSPAASSIFHDATVASSGVTNCTVDTPSMCNNSTPAITSLTGGLAGYLLTSGYDQATGWGSLDVGNFIRAAVPVKTTLALTTNATQVATTQSFSTTATLNPAADSVAAPTGTVQFESNGVALAPSVALANNSASTTLSLTTPGTYTLTAAYSGDAYYSPSTSSPVQVIVTAMPPSFTLSPASSSLSFASGAASGNSNSIGLTSTSGFVGNVALSCNISGGTAAFPPTCAISPTSSTLAANGTATSTVTIASTAPQASGALPLLPSSIGIAWTLLCGFGLLPTRLYRWKWLAMFITALFGLLLTMEGCGSGPSTPPGSSAGMYTVTVTGGGTSSGALTASTASTTFSVTIN
jgi:subtilase family serine protease